jgi:hypothetical protein
MDEMDRTTLGHDDEHAERLEVQARIQDVLDTLQREMAGASVEDVTVAINRRLADAGIPEQPHRWVQGMAERISTGRVVVADTQSAVEAVQANDPESDVGAASARVDAGIAEDVRVPQDAVGGPAHDPSETTREARFGGEDASGLGLAEPESVELESVEPESAEPESVEPGSVAESQATPPPANPR